MSTNHNMINPDGVQSAYGLGIRLQAELRNKRFIRYVKAGHRTILYRRADVEKFIDSRTVQAIGGVQ